MAKYLINLPGKPSFSQKGFDGFTFPLNSKGLEIDLVDVKQGHDNYIISKKCTLIYYVLEGEGTFDVNNEKFNVKAGNLVEVPPGIEFAYSGKMKLLLIVQPPWFEGNEEVTKKNLDVE
jgi:mannose-6-phosphate isomerase-like protein (cupin superfamily)